MKVLFGSLQGIPSTEAGGLVTLGLILPARGPQTKQPLVASCWQELTRGRDTRVLKQLALGGRSTSCSQRTQTSQQGVRPDNLAWVLPYIRFVVAVRDTPVNCLMLVLVKPEL